MSRGREKANKLKLALNIMIKFWRIFPVKTRISLFEHFRNTSGMIGFGLRYTLLKTIAAEIGDNVAVFPGVYITKFDNLRIGNNVSIQPMSYIDGFGGVTIGDNVSIAHHTTIMSTEHNYSDLNVPIKEQGYREASVIIEDNVWIGAKVAILKGVTVKSGNIVAAGAIVTKTIPENNVILAGCPAKILKKR